MRVTTRSATPLLRKPTIRCGALEKQKVLLLGKPYDDEGCKKAGGNKEGGGGENAQAGRKRFNHIRLTSRLFWELPISLASRRLKRERPKLEREKNKGK